jgi:hypothetical protein
LQLTPTRNGEVITPLSAGEPARELRTRGEFVFVRTLDAAGWIQKDGFKRICSQ